MSLLEPEIRSFNGFPFMRIKPRSRNVDSPYNKSPIKGIYFKYVHECSKEQISKNLERKESFRLSFFKVNEKCFLE